MIAKRGLLRILKKRGGCFRRAQGLREVRRASKNGEVSAREDYGREIRSKTSEVGNGKWESKK